MSLTLTLRGVAAFVNPPHGANMLRRSSALHWTAPQSRISPSVTQSLGLVLLLGSTATGYALQLRRPKDERGVLCASASVSDTQVVLHRVGSTNHLPGGLVTTEHFFSVPLKHEDPSSPRIEVFVRELGLVKNKNKVPAKAGNALDLSAKSAPRQLLLETIECIKKDILYQC